jgi:hypothetical protein
VHITKKIGDRPFDFTNQGRGLKFFRRPQDKACVRTRTMQTSIEFTLYLNKEEMVNLDLGVKLDYLLHDLVILQA